MPINFKTFSRLLGLAPDLCWGIHLACTTKSVNFFFSLLTVCSLVDNFMSMFVFAEDMKALYVFLFMIIYAFEARIIKNRIKVLSIQKNRKTEEWQNFNSTTWKTGKNKCSLNYNKPDRSLNIIETIVKIFCWTTLKNTAPPTASELTVSRALLYLGPTVWLLFSYWSGLNAIYITYFNRCNIPCHNSNLN